MTDSVPVPRSKGDDLKLLAEPTDPVLPKAPVTRVRSYAALARASSRELLVYRQLEGLERSDCRRSAMRHVARPQPRRAHCQRQPVLGARLPRVGHSPYPVFRRVLVRLAGTIGRALPRGV